MKKWSWRLIGGLAAAVVIGAIVYGFLPSPLPVEVAVIARGPLVVTIEEEGELRVRDRFVVAAPVTGVVSRIELEPGDPVTPGRLLATVRPSRAPLLDPQSRATTAAALEAALDARRQSEASIARATALASVARKNHQRIETLAKAGAATGQELDAALAERQARESELAAARFAAQVAAHQAESARAMLSGAGAGPADGGVAVTSPIAGTVLKVLQQSESPVTPGAPLLELGDLRALEVVADLLTRDAARLRPGMRALLEGWGGERALQARVRKIEPSAATILSPLGVREQRVNVVLDLVPTPEPLGLGDGFAAQVRFIVFEAEQVLKVPRSALFRQGNGWALFAERGGRARLVPVKLGQQSSTEAELLEGLAEGSRVILHPPEAVHEGAAVKAVVVPSGRAQPTGPGRRGEPLSHQVRAFEPVPAGLQRPLELDLRRGERLEPEAMEPQASVEEALSIG